MFARVIIGIVISVCWTVPATAYELRTNEGGKVLIWNKDEVDVIVDTSSVDHLPGVDNAIRAAFASWTAAGMPLGVSYEMKKGTSESGSDNKNMVRWETEDWRFEDEVVAMTISMYDRGDGFVTDSDIVLNAVGHQWTTDPQSDRASFDVQNVLTHEVGHFIGLGHSAGHPEATMYATTPVGEFDKRTLADDDLSGLGALVEEVTTRRHLPRRTIALPGGLEENVGVSLPERSGGCNVAATVRDQGAALLLILLLALRGARRRLASLITAGCLLLSAAPAQATVVRALTLEQMTGRSNVVVEGRVISRQARWLDGVIVTEHTIAVSQCLRGRCGAVVILRTLGGEVGDRGMRVEGVARPNLGDRVVLFGRGGQVVRAVGLAQGLFSIRDRTAVRDLKKLQLAHPGGVVDHGTREAMPLDDLLRVIRSVQPRETTTQLRLRDSAD